MRKLFFVLLACTPMAAIADSASDFAAAMQDVRTQCGGISEKMSHLKTMAGINTAVTAVGTVAGGVAVGTGIVKSQYDSISDDLAEMIERYKSQPATGTNPDFGNIDWNAQQRALQAGLNRVIEEEKKRRNIQTTAEQDNNAKIAALSAAKHSADNKSKTMGNIRTGTMAASTATNIAGAVIANQNKTDDELTAKIHSCTLAVEKLSNVKMIAYVEKSVDENDLSHADKIISACQKWSTVDLGKINTRARGATISSVIGAATGLSGTITSGIANTDKTRNSDDGREKNLNMASNVLAGATTAASATATIFNATQISAIKRAATVADECEGAL